MTKKINDGGAAFPIILPCGEHIPHGGCSCEGNEGGMSLRDYFAGQSISGLRSLSVGKEIMDSRQAAEMAYRDADAMLKAREVKPDA